MKCTPKVRQTFGGAIFMAKKGQVYKKYSPEFKLSVILDTFMMLGEIIIPMFLITENTLTFHKKYLILQVV